jgi:hypothetical protein
MSPMPRRILTIAALGCLAFIPVSLAGQGAAKPDFTGLWTNYTPPGAGRGGGAAGAGGGGGRGGGAPLPFTEEASKKVAAYRALIGTSGATPGGFCLGTGMPGSMLGSGGYPMEILQRPEQINITYEAHNEARRIYLGDRIVPMNDRIPGRNGHSSGRWEGDTLVVETTHLIEQVDQRYAHSSQAKIVERYSLSTDSAGIKVLTAEMTLTDPVFYTKPVTDTKRWAYVPNGHILPYECAEEGWRMHLEGLEKKAAGAKESK